VRLQAGQLPRQFLTLFAALPRFGLAMQSPHKTTQLKIQLPQLRIITDKISGVNSFFNLFFNFTKFFMLTKNLPRDILF
jgi:hypothetical protein